MTRIAGIVLAAGNSSRMGPEHNKLVEEIAGRPLVAGPVDALLEAGIGPVFVVTGFEAERVRLALGNRACRFVQHDAWAEGMGSTLAHGVRAILALATPPDALLVSVGDLPGLRAQHVQSVVEAARGATGGIDPSRIVIPTHRSRRGHPVLFGSAHFTALSRLEGDQGGRSIVEANDASVCTLDLDDEAILRDIDTPAELGIARAVSSGKGGMPRKSGNSEKSEKSRKERP